LALGAQTWLSSVHREPPARRQNLEHFDGSSSVTVDGRHGVDLGEIAVGPSVVDAVPDDELVWHLEADVPHV
jgi:hypothetical protein